MNLTALPALSDNYIWMFDDGRQAVVVDPGDALPVQSALASRGLTLAGILVTHHHGDHVGGVDALRAVLDGPVYGPARERIPAPFVALAEGDAFELLGRRLRVLDVPGHTAGHIAYYCDDLSGAPVVFSGDTLFSAGCGRLFEGTALQMHESLAKLAALPPETLVCCGHEYTLANLRFAQAVEPESADIAEHTQRCTRQRASAQPTLPSPLSLEQRINPFLRCEVPAVIAAALRQGGSSEAPAAVFAALREWKNTF